MQEERSKYKTEESFVSAVSNITMLNKQELLSLSYIQK